MFNTTWAFSSNSNTEFTDKTKLANLTILKMWLTLIFSLEYMEKYQENQKLDSRFWPTLYILTKFRGTAF
jgi:hypothetical protein